MKITEEHVEKRVELLNRLVTGKNYTRDEARFTVGCFCIAYEYGGVALHKVVGEGGSVKSDILGCGITTKKILFQHLISFINGINENN